MPGLVKVYTGDTVFYKGVKYKVGFAGKTKFGYRAKLQYLNGSKEFWVNLADVTPVPVKAEDIGLGGLDDELLHDPDLAKVMGILHDKKVKPESAKRTVFDNGPPAPDAYIEPKPKSTKPAYASDMQIRALRKFDKIPPGVEDPPTYKTLSYLEAEKAIRLRLSEL